MRLKGNTHTRKGSNGYTELVKGYYLPKSHIICFVNNEIQKTISFIKLWNIRYGNLLDDVDLSLLQKLANPQLNNLTALLWTKLELKQLVIIEDDINLYRERLSEINSMFVSASEFIVFDTEPALEFSLIVSDLRNIEHFVWKIIHLWYSENPMYHTQECLTTGDFYNMLGDYMFNLCRLIEKKSSIHQTEEYWKNPLTATMETQLNSLG